MVELINSNEYFHYTVYIVHYGKEGVEVRNKEVYDTLIAIEGITTQREAESNWYDETMFEVGNYFLIYNPSHHSLIAATGNQRFGTYLYTGAISAIMLVENEVHIHVSSSTIIISLSKGK